MVSSQHTELEDPLDYIPRYFRVITKESRLVPMILWPSQEYYIKNRTHRDVCLKNRQTGFSTGVLAGNSHSLFTKPYQRDVIVTHDLETSEYLFQTVQRFHRNLPEEMRPMTDWKSGHRMRFPLLDSYIYIDSANSDSLGIGHTISRAHLSEVAKWPPYRAEGLFADISQTVPEGGYITIESTPKGRTGIFYRLYDAARRGEINYKPFFFPWWWDITCHRPAENLKFTKEEQLLADYVKRRDNVDLSPYQIAFRREKLAELGELFYQEYPENDVDCWLSSDVSVFDGVAIKRYLQQISDGRRESQHLTIWKDTIGGEKYVIGVDVAAGTAKGDWSVASVIRCRTLEYVARLRGKIPPDFFAEEVLRLAARYNMAEVAIEKTGHGFTVLRIFLENNYPNLYYHQDYDVIMGKMASEPGWRTSVKTKPLMVDRLAISLRSGDLISWSENLVMEASSYIYNGQKAEKGAGADDDELDAVMIALQLRENAPIMEPNRYKPVSYVR